MKSIILAVFLILSGRTACQSFDSSKYQVKVDVLPETNKFFTTDPFWRGADGAASVYMGNGRVLWLFSDSFIANDSAYSRKGSKIIRNSIAIQNGYDLNTASLTFHWNRSGKKPGAFFELPGKQWF